MKQKLGSAFPLALFLLLLAGCGTILEKEDLGIHFSEKVAFPERPVIIFLVDGVNAEVFNSMLQGGELPSVQTYWMERGCRARNAVTSVVSTTYTVTTSLLTGLHPAHHGVPASKWFNRRQLFHRRYDSPMRMRRIDDDYKALNLFEMLPECLSVTILTQINRGVSHNIENFQTAGISFFFRWWETMDWFTIIRFKIIAEISEDVGEFPDIIVAYFAGTDGAGHLFGPYSKEYRKTLRNVDRQIGRLMKTLEENGVLERFLLIFVSDHGMHPVEPDRALDVAKYLRRELGIPTTTRELDEGWSIAKRARYLEKYSALVSHCGNRYACVYLRSFEEEKEGEIRWKSWRDEPGHAEYFAYPTEAGKRVNLVQELLKHPAIGIICWKDENGCVIVKSRAGTLAISRSNGNYQYEIIEGENPFENSFGPLEERTWYTSQEWLINTASHPYPDAVVQLAELLDSPRMGDLVLFASSRANFKRKEKGAHGGLDTDEMRIPFIIAGPGIRQGEIPAARIVDVLPTILDWMGADAPEGLDGRSLLPLIGSEVPERLLQSP